MFYYISGALALLDLNYAVVDAGGVGYRLSITQNTYSKLPHHSEGPSLPKVKLYTYMAVREDGIELFGFADEEELEMFKLLITVSGVGPKAAIAILSLLTPAKLATAVCSDDKKSISQANGVGPKTAARIILELKDKLKKSSFATDADQAELISVAMNETESDKVADARDALIALGYSKNEAMAVLRTIDTANNDLDDIIRLALKKIMK